MKFSLSLFPASRALDFKVCESSSRYSLKNVELSILLLCCSYTVSILLLTAFLFTGKNIYIEKNWLDGCPNTVKLFYY